MFFTFGVNQAMADTGPISYWSAEGNADDSIGINNGTLQNGATFAPGRVGQAFSFDGTDDYADVGNSTDFNITEALTLEAWIKTTNTSDNKTIIRKYSDTDGNNQSFQLYKNAAGYPVFMLPGDVGNDWPVTGATFVADGQWHHIVGTFDRNGGSDNQKIYVDGVLDGQVTTLDTRSLPITSMPVSIGGAGTEYLSYGFWNGLIDEVEIFNRALTAQEISDKYNSVPISKWSAEGNANDSVGTNNGTMMNGATFASGRVGQAFSFDGTDDYVSVANTGSMNFGTQDFTIDTWFKLNSLSGEQMFFQNYEGGAPTDSPTYLLQFFAPNYLRFLVRESASNNNDLQVSTSLATGQWYHLAAVRSGNTSNLYLDGALIGSQTAGNNVNTGTGGTVKLGNFVPYVEGDTRFLNGYLDELKIYGRALSASEITSIYDNTPPSVDSVSPVNSANDVPVNSVITVAFSEEIDASTIDTSSFTVSDSNGNIEGTVNYDAASKVATFTPSTNLSYSTTYTASISTAVKDSTGNNLLSDHTWSFTSESDLVSYWTAEGNANDSVGTNHGTMENGAAFAPGRVGQAFSFDGADDSITISNAPSLRPSNITVESWVKTPSTNSETILSSFDYKDGFTDGGAIFGINYNPGDGRIFLDLSDTAGGRVQCLSSDGGFNDNNWHHVVGTYEGSILKVYVDGIERGSLNWSNGIAYYSDTNRVRIGARSYSYGDTTDYYFNGLIDEVKIYRRALSASEIAGLYDFVPPFVESVTPVNSATDVPVNSTITASFSEAIDESTINTSSFTVSNGVTGTVDYDVASKTATFTPSSSLAYSTTYTASISTAVKDSSGNNLPSDHTWSFTTESAPPDTNPDAFNFVDQSDVELNTIATSNPITISGINTPTPISITGGEYSLNGGLYTSIPGTVNNGDIVVVQQISSTLYSTTTDAVLTIGDVSNVFSVTTIADTFLPTTSIEVDSALPINENGWYRTIPTVTLSSSEPGTISYSWNTTASINTSTEQTVSFIAPEGQNTLYYYSTDLAGNSEAEKTQAFSVDLTKPKITSHVVPTYSSNISPSTGFIVRWGATDPYSNGVKSGIVDYQIQYHSQATTTFTLLNINGSNWTTKTSTQFTKGAAGNTYYFRIIAKDNAGNTVTSTTKTTVIPYDGSYLNYSSGWNSVSSTTGYKNTLRYSSKKGEWARTKEFKGKMVTLIAPKGNNRGKLEAYIRNKKSDGTWTAYTKINTIDLYSEKSKPRTPFLLKKLDSLLTYQVKFVATGTKNTNSLGTRVDVDGLAVRR